MERIHRLSEKQPSSFTGTKQPRFKESIAFDGVSFGYTPEQKVISNLTVALDKSKKYALTGASGSGKTTLIRLLGAGFGGYSGQIKMDGLELRDMDVDQLLSKISVIHQNVYMFDETIKENIDLHREYTKDEWSSALTVSGVHILDEGTSSVDAPTAYDIETALLGIPDITMLTITHNLNPDLLRRYDRVLFMENGQIAESGSYDELRTCIQKATN